MGRYNSHRSRKSFWPHSTLVRDICNSEGRPPVQHLYQYSSAEDLWNLGDSCAVGDRIITQEQRAIPFVDMAP